MTLQREKNFNSFLSYGLKDIEAGNKFTNFQIREILNNLI